MFSRLVPLSCALVLCGCGFFGGGSGTKSQTPETETKEAEEPAPEAEEAPPVSLEEAMAPPEGLADVRPIFGTDDSTEKPALLSDVSAGMKIEDLDAVFPGVGKLYKDAVEANLTKKGDKWIDTHDAKEPYNEVISVNFLDDGGLWRVDYTFDPEVVSDAFWMYAQEAAKARWGRPRGDIGQDETLVSFQVKTLRILTLHRDGDKVRLEVDLRKP